MSGIRALRKIQMGRETTAGTNIVATTIWHGIGTLEDTTETTFKEEDIGYLSGVDDAYIARVGGKLEMDSVEATFEQTPHVLEAGVKTVTPVADGAGSGWIRTYTFPTTTPNTTKTYTLQGGDNQQAEVMNYSFVEEFSLEGKGGEAWKVSSTWQGRQITPQAFTAAASLPAVEDMLFGLTKVYIDAVSGTFGTTQKTFTLLAAKLTYKTGLLAKYTADGRLDFSFVQTTMPECTLELTFEHDATSVAEKAAWKAGTARLIRLKTEGNNFTTAGTAYSKKTMIIDVAGKWESFGPLDDQDGNDIYVGMFRGRYNATRADFGKIIMVNALSALP